MSGANQALSLDWLEQEFLRLDQLYRDLDGEISRRQLRHIWQDRMRPFWRTRRLLYLKFARSLLVAGENYLAIEVCEEGLTFFPQNRGLLFRLAQAYARSGSIEKALAVIEPEANREATLSPELAGLLGSLYNDLWVANAAAPERQAFVEKAHHFYQLALRRKVVSEVPVVLRGGKKRREELRIIGENLTAEKKRREERRITAISADAAVVALLAGDKETAAVTAGRRLQEAHSRFTRDPYSDAVNLGECSLVAGDLAGAQRHYAIAQQTGTTNRGDIINARTQARLLLGLLDEPDNSLDEYFPLPDVLVFAGHMIDGPQRAVPRFPSASAEVVRRAIREQIPKGRTLVGFSPAACGADILFLEEMQAANHETHIVLPILREDFRRESVAHGGADWNERYDTVLANATSVIEISSRLALVGANTFVYGNFVLSGMAHQEAKRLGSALRGLTVYDGSPAQGGGGAADCVLFWRRAGAKVYVIPPLAPDKPYVLDPVTPELPSPAPWTDGEEILTVLAAQFFISDSSSHEGIFLRSHFLDALSCFLTRQDARAYQIQFFHQSFYMVFRDPSVAGRAALELQKIALDFEQGRVPLSIGLHAGPVVLRRQVLGHGFEFLGPHVQKADALAAQELNSQIQVSREFDAITALDTSASGAFQCIYQGTRNLPGFAWQSIYRLQA